MYSRVYITGQCLLTPAGVSVEENWINLCNGKTNFKEFQGFQVGELLESVHNEIKVLRQIKEFRDLDCSVILAYIAGKNCINEVQNKDLSQSGAIVGSSRGPTQKIEEYLSSFLAGKPIPLKASPITTAGSLATFLAQQYGFRGFSTYLSSACTTSMHCLGVGISLLQSNLLQEVLVGGSETSITKFTIEMLKKVKVISPLKNEYPHRPLDFDRSGMVLSEGAAMIYLQKHRASNATSFEILGFGAANEMSSATGLSENALALQNAIKQALLHADISPHEIDLIVGHGSATQKGDAAELTAYQQIFENKMPPLTFHKWLTGHMLGASSIFSVILACQHIAKGMIPALPYMQNSRHIHKNIQKVLVCSMGFGGQASAVVISK